MLALTVGACTGFGFLVFWLPRLSIRAANLPATRRPTARIVPTIIDAACVGVNLYYVVSLLAAMQGGTAVSRDWLIISIGTLAILLISGVRNARENWSDRQPQSSAFAQHRRAELAVAYSEPTYVAYRRAIAPLHNRGFGRLAILAAGIGGMLVLAPRIGIGVALLVAFGAAMSTFLVLHEFADL